MNSAPRIAILLSTYNGDKFLAEQLDSLLSQSYDNTLIVVRDDGSSDDTDIILQRYMQQYPARFHRMPAANNLGASGSFSALVEYVLEHKTELGLGKAYMMFCDQDDTWFPDKIEKQVSAMLAGEKNAGLETTMPILVHSDLQVVSEKNDPIAPSLVDYQGLEIERNRFPNMVISNLVTGCTALINEELARKAMPVAPNAIMHDWWLAIVAAAFGQVIYLDAPLIHYRQHGNNTIGAKEFVRSGPGTRSFWQRLFGAGANQHLIEVARQAREFRQRFGSELVFRDRVALGLSSCMTVRIGVLQRFFYRLARRF